MPDPTLPAQIKAADVAEALESLGIPVKNSLSLDLKWGDGITVVYRRQDEDGNTVAAGREVATATYRIGVSRD